MNFREEDWRGSDRAEQSRKLEEFLREEREQGFDLTRGPLMKVGLAQVSEDAYYFIWGNHHILFDGWCRQLIIGEVFKLYEGYSRGVEVEMGRARPYRDYIAWLGEQNLSEAEEFWREELRGIEGPTQLGIERAGGSDEAEFEEKSVRVSEEASRRLEEVAKRWQVTLNTVVEGAWSVVMSRYSGQQEVVLGATASGRGSGLNGIEGMVGLFINTLPVRVEVRGEERVSEMMRRVQDRQSKVLEYDYSPLMEVQGWSEVGRGVPLFETIYVFQNYPLDAGISEKAGAALSISEVKGSTNNNYGITVRGIPGRELLLDVVYDSGRYEAGSMERMLSHLRRVLEGMTENEQSRVNELPMMSRQEQEEVIVEWNQTAAEYPRESCVHELFEQQVEMTPDAVAVVYEGESLTYLELNRRANQLAHYLQKLGVGPESIIGICLDRSVEMVVAVLGVLKAGGAYLPLDPAYPKERLQFMLEDSQSKLLITEEAFLEGLPSERIERICLDRESSSISREGRADPEPISTTDNLAYVIYTSGSTGKPKGAMNVHRGVCNRQLWMQEVYPLTQSDAVLQLASFSFDFSIWEFFGPLSVGARVIMPRPAAIVTAITSSI